MIALDAEDGLAAGAAVLAASAVIVGVLACGPLRRRFARVTRRAPQDDERALVRVGGLALAAGVAAASAFVGEPQFELEGFLSAGLGRGIELWPTLACVAALCLGLVDDLLPRGLGPGAKFVGQLAVGGVLVAPLVLEYGDPTRLAVAFMLVGCAVVAQNALNTFDNADGAAGGLALLALGASLFPFSAALLGFLGFNLPWRGRTRALLGDAGSHALGLAFLVTPCAWPALAVPLLDLARVVRVRRREGRPIWRGDRTHLAHLLAAAGLAPFAVALWLAALSVPSAVLGGLGVARGEPWLVVTGVGLGALAFAATLGWLARRERRATAC
ncbi:MAG: hypothetical protein L6Q99_10835 [Planctomycetes bacterium]|nr:hypothetical protein [Planctomycetota bacterium]